MDWNDPFTRTPRSRRPYTNLLTRVPSQAKCRANRIGSKRERKGKEERGKEEGIRCRLLFLSEGYNTSERLSTYRIRVSLTRREERVSSHHAPGGSAASASLGIPLWKGYGLSISAGGITVTTH
jgi:hypothetical protein